MAAARHTRRLQDMQCVRATDVRFRHPCISLTKATRLSQDHMCNDLAFYCNNAGKHMTTTENRTMAALRVLYDVWLCLAAVLQICTTILRQPCM